MEDNVKGRQGKRGGKRAEPRREEKRILE